ncbi:MAG: HAMP domain-containing sensor histidine kinase, partial [Firmicutes bacterium]|nr:HAMP domain-containing sensor histidine kinase [Bacillota bacterium]
MMPRGLRALFERFSTRIVIMQVVVATVVLSAILIFSRVAFRNYLINANLHELQSQGMQVSHVMQGYFVRTISGSQASYLVSALHGTLDDRLYVVNSAGQVLLETGTQQQQLIVFSPSRLRQVLHDGEVVSGVLTGPKGQNVIATGIPVIVGNQVVGGIFLESSLAHINHIADSLYHLLLIGVIIAIALVAGLSYILTRRLTHPLENLRLAVAGMESPSLQLRAPVEGPLEIRELAREFNRMADHINAQLQQLKNEGEVRDALLAHVAHDLRTPLTSIRGFLEAAKDGVVTGEARTRAIAVAWEETLRLKRLVDRLLAATKIQQGIGNKTPVTVSLWIRTTLERLAPLLQETGHRVQWQEEGPDGT